MLFSLNEACIWKTCANVLRINNAFSLCEIVMVGAPLPSYHVSNQVITLFRIGGPWKELGVKHRTWELQDIHALHQHDTGWTGPLALEARV
jgi:hypothetical protein